MEIRTAAEFKALRKGRLKVTQQELADKLGLTMNYISLVETGRKPVTPALLLAVAQSFKLQFTWTIK
jgi:transcriptional regulator with XRE-family HTH domain